MPARRDGHPPARSTQQVSTGGRQCFSSPNPQTTCFCKTPVQPPTDHSQKQIRLLKEANRRHARPSSGRGPARRHPQGPGQEGRGWASAHRPPALPCLPGCLQRLRHRTAGHGGTGRDTVSRGPEFPSWLTSALRHLQQEDPSLRLSFPKCCRSQCPRNL